MSPRHVVHVFTVPDSLVFLTGQVSFMRERGWRISVVTSAGPRLDAFGKAEGVDTYAIEMPRRVTPLNDLRSVAQLAALLRRLKPDLVHAHTPKGGLLGMIAATAAGVGPRIYHMRGLPLATARGSRRAILEATERVSCGLATRVLCVSPSLRAFAIDRGLVRPSKIQVLLSGSGNGVDCTERFAPDRLTPSTRSDVRAELGIPANARVVGYVGRLVRDKGIVELTDAWTTLRARFPDAHLVLAGIFEDTDPLPASARAALEHDERVHLVGFRDDTPRLYAALDIVTLPSHREGFPNVPLEASAMKCPVVTTRATGCVDSVVDGVTGTLVPVGEASALADAIGAYLANEDMRRAHGDAGRTRVEQDFARERIWGAIEGVYRELVGA